MANKVKCEKCGFGVDVNIFEGKRYYPEHIDAKKAINESRSESCSMSGQQIR